MNRGAGIIAERVKCFPCEHENLSVRLLHLFQKLGMVTQVLIIQALSNRGSRIAGSFWLPALF